MGEPYRAWDGDDRYIADAIGPGVALSAELNRAADATGRTRFVLVRDDYGAWSFGAPSMLSYSPRAGDMVIGATATEAMRAWIEANDVEAEIAP